MVTFADLVLSLAAFLIAISIPAAAAATTCENLSSLKLKGATVAAQSVPAGVFAAPGTKNTVKATAAFCRVALTPKPSTDSDIDWSEEIVGGFWF